MQITFLIKYIKRMEIIIIIIIFVLIIKQFSIISIWVSHSFLLIFVWISFRCFVLRFVKMIKLHWNKMSYRSAKIVLQNWPSSRYFKYCFKFTLRYCLMLNIFLKVSRSTKSSHLIFILFNFLSSLIIFF